MKNGIVPHSVHTNIPQRKILSSSIFFPLPITRLKLRARYRIKRRIRFCFSDNGWITQAFSFLIWSPALPEITEDLLILLRDQFCFCTHARFLQWAFEGLTKVYRFMNAFWTNGIFTEKVCENSWLYHRRLINTTLYLCNEAPSMRFQVHSCMFIYTVYMHMYFRNFFL